MLWNPNQIRMHLARLGTEKRFKPDSIVTGNAFNDDLRALAKGVRDTYVLMHHPSNKWDVGRIKMFQNYCQVMEHAIELDDYNAVNFASKDDIKFIKRVSRDSTELAYVRGLATKLWSIMSLKNCEFEASFQCLHRVIKICRQASEEERQFRILCDRQDSLGVTTLPYFERGTTLGDCLKELEEHVEIVYSQYRDIFFMGDSPLLWDEKGTDRDLKFMGCDVCLPCGKTYEDLGVIALDCCQTCQLTYYCSHECQEEDWNEHKKVCRRPGEFKKGDMANLADPACLHISFGKPVELWVRVPNEPLMWYVRETETNASCCKVHTKDLRRTRPAYWTSIRSHESEIFCEALAADEEAEAAVAAGTLTEEEAEAAKEAAEDKFQKYFIKQKLKQKATEIVNCAEEKVQGLLDYAEIDRILNSKIVLAARAFLERFRVEGSSYLSVEWDADQELHEFMDLDFDNEIRKAGKRIDRAVDKAKLEDLDEDEEFKLFNTGKVKASMELLKMVRENRSKRSQLEGSSDGSVESVGQFKREGQAEDLESVGASECEMEEVD